MSDNLLYTASNPHPTYQQLLDGGSPELVLNIPGLHTGPAVLLSTNLDGSRWVMFPHSGTLCVEARYCTAATTTGARTTDPATAHRAWESQAAGMSANQVKVLVALRDAGDWGMIDHDHEPINGLKQDTAGKRRLELQAKGLVAEKPHATRPTPRGARAQVWVITQAGQQALRTGRPPSLPELAAGIRRAS